MLHRIDTASVHATENNRTTNGDTKLTGHQQETSYTTVLHTAMVYIIDSQKYLYTAGLYWIMARNLALSLKNWQMH